MDDGTQIQIDNLLSHLRYYRALPDNEIIDSKETIISFVYNLYSLTNPYKDSSLRSLYEGRVCYFELVYDDGIDKELEKIKEIILKFNKSLQTEKNCQRLYVDENEIEGKFKAVFKFLIGFPDNNSITQNIMIIENCAKLINWSVAQRLNVWKARQHGYFDDESLLNFLQKNNHVDIVNFHEIFIKKMIDIPRAFFIHQFLFFDEFLSSLYTDEFEKLSNKEFKKIIDVSIVILAELQNPCFIGDNGERVLVDSMNEEGTKKYKAKIEQVKQRNLKKQKIKDFACSNPDLTYAAIAEKVETSEQYVKNIMSQDKK